MGSTRKIRPISRPPSPSIEDPEAAKGNRNSGAGSANKSQLRTAVLSNGKAIWDLVGNVWEWNDWLCGNGVWYNSLAWVDWTNANLTDYEKYAAGPSGSLTGANGAGQYYGCSANGNAALRGSDWDNGANDGPFALALSDAPSNVGTSIGFRCAK